MRYYDSGHPVEEELLATRYDRLKQVIPRELFPSEVAYQQEIALALSHGYPNDKVNDKTLINIYSDAFRDIDGAIYRQHNKEIKDALGIFGQPASEQEVNGPNSNSYSIMRNKKEYSKAIPDYSY